MFCTLEHLYFSEVYAIFCFICNAKKKKSKNGINGNRCEQKKEHFNQIIILTYKIVVSSICVALCATQVIFICVIQFYTNDSLSSLKIRRIIAYLSLTVRVIFSMIRNGINMRFRNMCAFSIKTLLPLHRHPLRLGWFICQLYFFFIRKIIEMFEIKNSRNSLKTGNFDAKRHNNQLLRQTNKRNIFFPFDSINSIVSDHKSSSHSLEKNSSHIQTMVRLVFAQTVRSDVPTSCDAFIMYLSAPLQHHQLCVRCNSSFLNIVLHWC